MYSIVQRWLCPRLCIFRNPVVLPEPETDWQCQAVTFWTNPSILYAVTSLFVPLPVWSLGLCSLSASSWQRVCHGSCKWAYGGSRSPSIRTSHVSRLDEGCFLVDKYHVKCSICMKTCVVFCAEPRGFQTLCPDWQSTLSSVDGPRCPRATAYFWTSFGLISCFSAPICLCTRCKFRRKISGIQSIKNAGEV